jgi:hypothetical protein
MMRHQKDCDAWKSLDKKYKRFVNEATQQLVCHHSCNNHNILN